MHPVLIGTAGHIDHGKTSLVKALTGIDADRLEEEKRRGITIDLGFAHTTIDGVRLSFIDVPGHERFVRNMLAGVGGIDVVLFVVAADQGIMPQTREHFEICRMLDIRRGIVALTKSDTLDNEWMSLRREEVAKFFAGSFLDESRAPHLAVSATTGAGIPELKAALAAVARKTEARSRESLLRLPIDRVFTMRGFGTVVTGTLVAGRVERDTEIEVQPSGKRARVRGVQVHGEATNEAVAGERAALNLAGPGLAKDDLQRGQVIVAPGTLSAVRRFEAWIELSRDAKPLKTRSRVHLHAFTAEAIAEVMLRESPQLKPGESGYAQLHIAEDQPAMQVLPGDRFILRQFSPVVTIGGGRVLDSNPLNKRLSGPALVAFLARLRDGSDDDKLLARIERRGTLGLSAAEAVQETGWTPKRVGELAKDLVELGKVIAAGPSWVASEVWTSTQRALLEALQTFHAKNPLAAGIGREALRDVMGMREPVFSALLQTAVQSGKVVQSQETIHLAGHKVTLRTDESLAHSQIEEAFKTAGLKVPTVKEVLMQLPVDRVRAQKIVAILLRDKVLVKVTDDLLFHASALAGLKAQLAREKAVSPRLDVARFKDLTGISRKYAIPLLEWLDRERVTRRVGDARVIL